MSKIVKSNRMDKVKSPERAHLIEMINFGMTIQKIADRKEVSYSTAKKWLKDADLKTKKRLTFNHAAISKKLSTGRTWSGSMYKYATKKTK